MIGNFVLLLLALVLAAPAQVTGSDVDKERRWVEQVIDGLLDGDELWLRDGSGHEFPSVLKSAERRAMAGEVIGPGMFRQISVDGTGRFSQGHEAELLRQVMGWPPSRTACALARER